MFVVEDNKLLTFSEFLVSESIKPKIVDYGTDLNNKEWKRLNYNSYITAFKSSGLIYIVFYRNGYIGLFSGKVEPFDNLEYIDSFEDLINVYNMDRTNTSEGIIIFNKAFYVFVQIIKLYNPKQILFDGNDKDLGGMYEKIVQNKFFLNQIKELGYCYVGKIEDLKRNYFKFERITT